ncbi:BES1/BZR1 homolog protein 4-like isoform X3 [Gossypium arboreum]|uniref:BES1/BZR1 homolog protein 4-like isoform X3 n=1 Tax=Gossypium arboreum TaxID=29729 RepID=UPI0022F1CE54|nr:BES1/BZR1 homolog protein 4-like isoform X3 [Gossypium arboreum]
MLFNEFYEKMKEKKKGCKPVDRMDIMGGSASASPCSSYHPSPGSSSFPSPASSHYTANANGNADANSLIPWLKNLSSGSSSASSKLAHHLFIAGGSISAPVTPPLSSPTSRTPRTRSDWDEMNAGPTCTGKRFSYLPASTPPSPSRQVFPDPGWLSRLEIPQSGPTSPTFSLVSRNPFGFKDEALSRGGSRMWTPGQSGTCSPAFPAGVDQTSDVPMSDAIAAEFAFGSNMTGLVKPWEGEKIHEECVADDLELTLGNSKTR